MPKRKTKEPLPPDSDVDLNPEFTKLLKALEKKAEAGKDWMRQRAYAKAGKALERFGWVITEDNYKRIKELEGVGAGCVKRAKEWLDTGTIADAAEYLQDPANVVKETLEKVQGIGATKADELIGAGVRSLADLRSRPTLVASALKEVQQSGLRFARETNTPIKAAAAQALADAVAVALAPGGFTVTAVGGLRRGEATLSEDHVTLMVTHAEYTFEDYRTVGNFRSKAAVAANPGPQFLDRAVAALDAAGLLVERFGGANLQRLVLAMRPEERAGYDMPAPLLPEEGSGTGADGDAAGAGGGDEDAIATMAAAATSAAPVAAAGLFIPDLDDAEEEAEGAAGAIAGVWKKHGGLQGARAAASTTVGGRKRRADGPVVQLAPAGAAAAATAQVSELAPVEGPCPHLLQLHMVPANFAGAARFWLTGPTDYGKKVGLKVGKYALAVIESLQFKDGTFRMVGRGGSAVLRPIDKPKKPTEVTGAPLPVTEDSDVYTALGVPYLPPAKRFAATPVPVGK